ncbi:MAG TPA: AcrB/AcrD/AcrF family protein [Bacteroidetes bacterium]|nr:AcrB/AcrD/AcrF family protein [Bacteroidota bacterium]
MKGAIEWMARNRVAANLLMVFIVLVGFVSVSTIVQEVFPEASLDSVQVRVPYLGASPEEVEESIVRRVEEKIQGVDGIRQISSVAAENLGVITAQLKLGENIADILDEIKSEVDRITTFPAEAEEPEITEITTRRQAIQLAVYGDVPERTLKELTNRMKDELTASGGVSFAEVGGTRNYELAIEISEETLRSYGLTLDFVTRAVRRGSLDLPGGSIETSGEDILIRTKGQAYSGRDFEKIPVRALSDGSTLYLGDIATVRDGFEESDAISRFNGEQAAFLKIYRTSDERVLDVIDEVYAYVETLSIPEGISVSVWQDEAKLLRSRYELMLKNGAMGLALVILALGLFLNSRLAFWVSAGIFISFIGTFAVMVYIGATINLISLVAFILALGIVVDDAIVVGENVFVEQENGLEAEDAAVKGTVRLARPVIFAVLTTMAAFTPLLFVPGIIGKMMKQIPTVMITVLAISLIESLFILPAHLGHFKFTRGRAKNMFSRGLERIQNKISALVEWNINGPLHRTLEFVTEHYVYVVLAGISIIMLSVGTVGAGWVRFEFFPNIEGDNVVALVKMPEGTPVEKTIEIAALMEEKGHEVAAQIQSELDEDHPPVVSNVLSIVGSQPTLDRAPVSAGGAGYTDPTLAEVNFELLASEIRELPAVEFETRWREAVGDLAAVRSIQYQSSLISLGKSIQLEVSTTNAEDLALAVAEIKDEIRSFSGTYEIEDDRVPGKREVMLELKPGAQMLGISLDDLARQVRASFYGNEALRVQRGRDDVRVMIRLPQDERDALSDLDNIRIRTAGGEQIPFSEIASASIGFGSSTISRRDRRQVTTISAQVNEDIVASDEVISILESTILPRIGLNYPGFNASFEGEQREQMDAISSLKIGFLIALFMIYALLAIPFKSYTQPLIIMAAIPFGIIGALVGHIVMGLAVGILSIFGIIGLAGEVVNDSLVLIDYVNKEREKGLDVKQAVINAGKVRFRPIMLTSVTTFVGVLPLILERSLQAQFLIPIAASLGFGILFATFIIMIIVPALVIMEAKAESVIKGWKSTSTESSLGAEPAGA